MPVNPSFPLPQADRLSKVAVVIDAVGAGVDTTAAIAEALEMVDRQGAYYVAAAGYLGLLQRQDTVPVTYALTVEGHAMLDAGPAARAALVLATVAQVPEVDIYLNGGLPAVRARYGADLDDVTAARRANTIASWTATVTGPGLSAAVTATDAAAVAAAAASIRERTVRRRAGAPVTAVCPGCYMQLPATGVCQSC